MTPTIENLTMNEVKQFHDDIQKWNASMYFIENEIQFITKKLHSYVFEPTTPNLFELLQEFKFAIIAIDEEQRVLTTRIQHYENELRAMVTFDTITSSDLCIDNHEAITVDYKAFYKRFQKLKTKVLTYTGGALRHHKQEILETV